MSGLPTLSGSIDDGLSLLQGAGLPYLMPTGAYPPTTYLGHTTTIAQNFFDTSTPGSTLGDHNHQQQQYIDSPLLLASQQPLLRAASLQNLSGLIHHQPNLNLNYLSLLNTLGRLPAQGAQVRSQWQNYFEGKKVMGNRQSGTVK